jgi:hypothetical protein
MHILLINANPVVSRLLVLCTRDDTVVLEEVDTVEAIEGNAYDIVFVDETSYGRDVADVLGTLGSAKKVFISYRSDSMRGFDITIKKPFLPSQITDLIKEIEVRKIDTPMQEENIVIESDEKEEEIPSIFPLSAEENVEEIYVVDADKDEVEPTVLDSDEIEKIKALLDMDDDLEVTEEVLTDEEIEARKVALIKEQLIADGLEIVEEAKIVEELSIDLDGTLKKSKVKNKKSKSKKIKFTEENMERIEDAVEMAMATMTKKQMKHLLKGKEIEMRIKLRDND